LFRSVAIVGAGTAASVRKAAVTKQLTDTTTLVVQRSYAELEHISTALGTRLAAANEDAPHGLQAAIDVKHNTVRLDLPKGKNLTDTQHDAIRWASQQFGNAVSFGAYDQPSVPRYCGGQYYCDPPLRSGLATYMGGGRCTTAFMTYSGSAYYMLTAGHCAEIGYYFYVPTYYYGTQYVGYAVDYDFGYWGDSALIYIEDAAWWRPRGWVYPQTVIRSYGYDYVGQYVCKQGSTTGYTCGRITQTNATVHYPDRTLTGMTWSTACVAAGDSGSGVYYGSRAHGILSGGPYSGCGMIHEPVTRALSRWGVNLLSS
ncbi:MAG TPA: protease, partial [Micromonosporaceae bacterium]|nr:protease [Micromonosporaceae bacterium]